MKKTTITSLLLALGLAGASQAATVVFDTSGIGGTGESTGLGQSFTTGTLGLDNKLSTIELDSSFGSGDAQASFSATLRLFADLDGNASTWDSNGTPLATSDTQNIDPGTASTVFTFASLPVLSDSTVYLIQFVNNTEAGTRLAFNSDPGTTGSTGGEGFRLISADGSTGTVLAGNDFGVKVTTIPEPSSTALLGLAGFGLLVRRRK